MTYVKIQASQMVVRTCYYVLW